MSITVSDLQDRAVDVEMMTTLAGIVCEGEGVSTDTELAVVVVDADAMEELNVAHMGKDGPTDVLAFPLETATPGHPPTVLVDGPPLALGDVYICPDVVAANAAEAGVRFEDEMALMVVHGILHLLGYDHVEDGDAALMEGREAELMALIGLARP
ncbi:MAG: rRNA maturation RNase YbeY [Acidimicrobiia bacterium]|nr:rRNA maturation RNase YbeY [Acidimicrobiia bacterium]